MYFVLRTNQIISNQIISSARAHFKGIVLTRRWNSDYGGVFVKKNKAEKLIQIADEALYMAKKSWRNQVRP